MPRVNLLLLDRYNWEATLDLRLTEAQEGFVPSVLYSLAQAKFEALTPYGIGVGEKIVGLLMYGNFGGICWINRILVDERFQRQGIGKAAVQELLARLQKRPDCAEIRTSYSPENVAAAAFFQALGFVPLDSPLPDEVVARYEG
jgi:diamine N-acetyltransferase